MNVLPDPSAVLALALPLASFLLLALIPPLRRTGRQAGLLSTLAAFASLLSSLRLLGKVAAGEGLGTWTLPWLVSEGRVIAEVGLHVDGLSATMLVVVTLVASCVQAYSLGYLAEEPRPDLGRYFTWHSLFVVAMGLLVLAPNLLQLFFAWELVGLCSYLLIGFYWRRPSAGRAAVKAFWVTKFADMGLLLGLIVLYAATGGFSWTSAPPAAVATLVPALLFVGVMGKSAQFPLHIWLPDAMEGPTPVSALLHAATMVAAGVFLVVRAWPLFEAAPALLGVMAWLGAATALMAAVTAVVQDDIKKVLAYSTCSQLGFMVAGLGSGQMMGAYFHLTTHAFFKALLFLGAGAAIHAVHSNDIHQMGGLWRSTRRSALLFLVGAGALAGLPGLAGFFSKDLILEELLHAGQYGPLALLLLSAGLTAFYMTRVAAIAFFGPPAEGARHAHEAPLVMLLPMALLALPALGAGFAGAALAGLWGQEYHFALTPVGALATAMALGGIALGVLRYGTRSWAGPLPEGPRRFILSGPVDGFWLAAWQRGLLPLSHAVAWTDRYIVDALMNAVGVLFLKLGEAVRRLQTGRAQDYVLAVSLGALFVLAYGLLGGA